jgi:hypothetical protein
MHLAVVHRRNQAPAVKSMGNPLGMKDLHKAEDNTESSNNKGKKPFDSQTGHTAPPLDTIKKVAPQENLQHHNKNGSNFWQQRNFKNRMQTTLLIESSCS